MKSRFHAVKKHKRGPDQLFPATGSYEDAWSHCVWTSVTFVNSKYRLYTCRENLRIYL